MTISGFVVHDAGRGCSSSTPELFPSIDRPIPRPETIAIAGFCTLPLPWTVLPKRSIKPSAGFHSLEVELEYLDSLEHKTQKFGPPYLFEPPFFIAKRGKETNELLNHYKKSTEKLSQIYLKKSFSRFLTEINTQSKKKRASQT